jgi:hypothetical protein
MAITKIGVTQGGNIKSYQGLAADDKPTDCGSGSVFYELDSGLVWAYDAANGNPATSDGWWEIA